VSPTLLLDEDISYEVARALRQQGVDAISVYETGRADRRVSDEEQLEEAVGQGRVLITYNRADFQALDARRRTEGRSHAGIIWCSERTVPRRAIGELARLVAAMAARHESLVGLCLPLSR
jgi:predicted nuclease of predicted toxin-antitoxin system